jgi:hypothetical protein
LQIIREAALKKQALKKHNPIVSQSQ